MRFLGDMGVSYHVTDWLRTQGHDAIHLREQGLHRLPDQRIFDKAHVESRVILTFDLDFGEILAMSKSQVVSVILFRVNNAQTAFVIRRLQTVLADSATAIEAGAIIVVEDGRHRVRKLPLGS